MELDVSELIKILSKQKSLIDELLNLSCEQLQALKQDDLDKIIYITSHQEYVGRQLAVLEQQRRIMLEQYCQDLEIEIKHFSELSLYTSRNDFAEMEMIRDEITDGCQKLQEDNELNALLLKQSLNYTQRVLGVLNSKKSFVYGKTGDIKRAGNIGIVDANV